MRSQRMSRTELTKRVLQGPVLSGSQAWLVIAGFVFAHDLTCPKGQLLSEAVDRGLEKHPVLTTAAIAVTAAHLLNRLPIQLDPFHWLWQFTKGNHARSVCNNLNH